MADIKEIERKSSKIKFKVLLPEEEVKKAYSKTLTSLSKQIKVPGFRKGKVPINILRMHVGPEKLKSEVIDSIFSDFYSKARKELDFIPVGYPEITDLDFEEGKESFLEIEVDIEPNIELPNIEDIEVEKSKVDVTEKEVEDTIDELRHSMMTLEPIEDEEIKGERDEVVFAKLDIEAKDDELNEKYKDFFHKEEVSIYFEKEGLENLDKEVVERIKGAKIGEEVTFTYTFPDDFYLEDLRGKEVKVKIVPKDLKRIIMPDAGDEFAKDLGYETFEELRKEIYEKLKKEKDGREEIRLENQIIKELLNRTSFDPPEIYVKRRREALKRDFIEELKKNNLTLKDYLEQNNLREEDLEKYYEEEAKNQLKISMIFDEIKKEKNIEVEEEDIEKVMEDFASSYRISKEKVKELYERDEELRSYLRDRAEKEKIIKYLKKHVKIKEVDSIEKEESENTDGENK